MMRSANVLLPWSMWAMIEKLRMWSMPIRQREAKSKRRKLSSAQAHIASDTKGDWRASKLKKRHVQEKTRLPTKRMATACWALIVAKRTPRKAAPLLDFASLHAANTINPSTAYPQAFRIALRTQSGCMQHRKISGGARDCNHAHAQSGC